MLFTPLGAAIHKCMCDSLQVSPLALQPAHSGQPQDSSGQADGHRQEGGGRGGRQWLQRGPRRHRSRRCHAQRGHRRQQGEQQVTGRIIPFVQTSGATGAGREI